MKKVFPILAVTIFSSILGSGIIAPILPLFAESLGASAIWIGVIFSGFSISRAIFMPFIGNISDRKGRKIFICVGLIVYAVISLGYIWANQITELTFVRLIHGFASAMIVPIALAYIGELSPEGEEGKWMGYSNAAFFTGFGFGPLLGGVLTDYFSMEVAFYSMGALNLLAFLLAISFLPEIRPKERVTNPPSLIEMRESGVMKGIFSFRVAQALGMGVFICFLPLFGDRFLELSPGRVGMVLAIHILLMATSQWFSGRIADIFNKKGLIIIGSSISLTFLALIPSIQNLWQLLALSIFGAIGSAISMPAASALIVEEGRKYGMGSAMGVFSMAMSIGMSIGPIIGGLIADTVNMESVFYFGASARLLGIGLLVWFAR